MDYILPATILQHLYPPVFPLQGSLLHWPQFDGSWLHPYQEVNDAELSRPHV